GRRARERLVGMRRSVVLCFAGGALAAQGRPDPALSAGPMGAWIMGPELPGMGRRVDAVATAARRRALMTRLGRGVVLIPAAHQRDTETEYVQAHDFRQHNTFFYSTDLEPEDASLLMLPPTPHPTARVLLP